MHPSDDKSDMRPLIIGIAGPAGSGKSTAAAALVADGYQRLPLALPLKVMLREGLGLTEAETDGTLKEVTLSRLGLDVTPRVLLQTLGTEWGRSLDPQFWLKAWQARASKLTPLAGQDRVLIVVDDLRFLNEALFLRSLGGRILCIVGSDPTLTGAAAIHASEAGWPVIRDMPGTKHVRGGGSVRHFQDRVRRAAY